MTRNQKVNPEELEREYIYDQGTPPVSFSQLAERHGVTRSTVADRGIKGRWFERRKAFREQLGMKVTEAMGDEWVRLEAAVRERLMTLGLAYLARYEKDLAEDKVSISTRDMIGVAAMLRTLSQDAATARVNGEEVSLIDPDNAHLDPDSYRRALRTIERLEAGDEPFDAEDPEATGTEGAGAD